MPNANGRMTLARKRCGSPGSETRARFYLTVPAKARFTRRRTPSAMVVLALDPKNLG
jgi:hypothetical protein